MPNFQRFLADYPFANRVRRLGVLSDGEKRDFFAGLDLFALPSRSDSFGLVLLEAWANGLPVIAYRAGGVADVIRHGVDGYLSQGRADLTHLLADLCRDAGTRTRFGTAGRERLA